MEARDRPTEHAVAMLYSKSFREHPWEEDIYYAPGQLQRQFRDYGLEYHVAVALSEPGRGNVLPEVTIARDPVFNDAGTLIAANFQPGDLSAYPAVIDHNVPNFQQEVDQGDGTTLRTANGVGLKPSHLWNHKAGQGIGNRKDRMDVLLHEEGVGIKSVNVLDFEQLGDDTEVIYKPVDGSEAGDIEYFSNFTALRRAIAEGRLATNGLVQPYFHHSAPIQGLVPANDDEARLLREVNGNRLCEIRMHVLVTIDDEGQPQVESYPTLKFSLPGKEYLRYGGWVGLDPSCIPEGSFTHDKTVALGKRVSEVAGQDTEEGQPIQLHGAIDWYTNGHILDPENNKVGEGNWRGPSHPVKAVFARRAVVRGVAYSAHRNLRQAA